MIIQFLCGCKTANVEGLENLLTMSSVTNDEEGMLICSIHRQRRYGWRSVGRDHTRDRLTPLEIEALDLWGLVILRPDPAIGLHTVEDIRDNRDPQEVWETEGLHIVRGIRSGFHKTVELSEGERNQVASNARKRLDLMDRTGWEIRDMQVSEPHL